MKRKVEAINEYYNEALGCMVKVYPPKATKRTSWQKNDTFYGAKMRIDDDTLFARFTRKAGRA